MAALDRFPKLTFTLEHTGPIPLGDFTASLSRVASRYGRFARARGAEEDARLYIAEVRQGSIEIDLVSVGAAANAVIEGVGGLNHVIEFGKDIAALLMAFRTGKASPADVSISDCEDARAMIRPALTAEGGGLAIAVNGDNNIVQPILLQIGRSDAQIIDNRAAAIREALAAPEEHLLKEVFFVWDQIRDAPAVEEGHKSPDRGVIAAMDKRPRQVTFAGAEAKEAMYHDDLNPFEVGFIVDAKVMIGPTGPVGYRILKVHEVVEKEPPEAA
jgi:hypothetical protein